METLLEKVSMAVATDTIFVDLVGEQIKITSDELEYTIKSGSKVLFVLTSEWAGKARTFENSETLIPFLQQMIKLERIQALFPEITSYLFVSGDSPYLQIAGMEITCQNPGDYLIEIEDFRTITGIEAVILMIKGTFLKRAKNPVRA